MIRRWFFLRAKWVRLTVLCMIVSLFAISYPWNWLVVACGTVWLWLHRRGNVPWQDLLKNDGEVFLAPIDGEVVHIGSYEDPEEGRTFTEVRLRMGYSDRWGLHLPSSAEMAFLRDFPGQRYPRKELERLTTELTGSLAKTDMVLKPKNGLAVRMRFLPCVNGRSPRIWMKSGDRGRGGACFGHYPFGGSLIVYVPQPSDILVVNQERVTAGQTVLAVFRHAQEESHGL